MPRGVKKTLSDKLYDLASAHPIEEFIDATAELFVFGTSMTGLELHQVFGEMNFRAQQMWHRVEEFETEQKALGRKKPGPKPKPKSLPAIKARVAKRVVKRAPRKTKA